MVKIRFQKVLIQDAKQFPIRRIHFTTPEAERDRLVADLVAQYERGEVGALLAEVEALLPRDEAGAFLAFQPGATGAEERSDVVHDLLAHLAERMIAMHEEKQARIEAFWAELAAAADPETFEALEKGKWEQTLAKDEVCRPFVDPESRSTVHLDDALAWTEGCFEAFAGRLVGGSRVTRPMVEAYRAHAPGVRALAERIAETDALIDQVVYRLYGLTAEEIAVVEGA